MPGVIKIVIRVLVGLIGAALIVVAASFALEGYDGMGKVDEAYAGEFIRLDVDLSKPGEYRGKFEQTYVSEHGQALVIRSEVFSKAPHGLALKELRALVTVRTEAGEVKHEQEVVGEELTERDYWDDMQIFIPMPAFPEGPYELVVRVTRGAPGCADVKQTLVGKYTVTGQDSFSHTVRLGAGLLGMLMGLVIIFLGAFAGRKSA
jgi:hypothetical protein